MLFNSVEFIFFFIIVTFLYFVLAHKYRWMLLLTASCYFYMAFVPVYILILGFTIVIDYFAGILIEQSSGKKKHAFLIASLISNIGVLAIFKYYNFIIENTEHFLNSVGVAPHLPYLSILLPIGLSFHTFQAMSYTIEVYRGHQKAERHFGIYSLYVMFYPQLVAGPIERPQNILHQFYEKQTFDYDRVTNGLKLMLWGFFKKVLIADRLAIVVNQVYDAPTQYEGVPLIIATIFFTFQIYCDFSGYSDIAIGAAKVMGFDLMKNFNRPYHSKTISEFWKRWHISLSTWFRDYLYIPLGGNRVIKWRWYYNLFITFLISGLWHGANWTYIIWGALHGFYLVFAIVSQDIRTNIKKKLGLNKFSPFHKYFQLIGTFLLVAFAWIFFRAKSVTDAVYIVTHLFSNVPEQLKAIVSNMNQERQQLLYLNQSTINFLIALLFIFIMELVHFMQRKGSMLQLINAQPSYFRWSIYISVILCILFFGITEDIQFIYFQF
jgi:alginate O-acetyltransferase complex protein AlgI